MRIIKASECSVLPLGLVGEGNRTTVIFSFSDLWDEFPGGVVSLIVTPPKVDHYHTILNLTIDDDTHEASWLVEDAELANSGIGNATLVYRFDDGRARSKTWETSVGHSPATEGVAPLDWQDISDHMDETAVQVREDADRAEAALSHGPYIDDNNHWLVWNAEAGEHVDTGVHATGDQGPQGPQGPQGETGPQGPQGPAGEVPIDDTTPALDKVYSSSKVNGEVTQLNQAIDALPKIETGSEWANKEELNTELVDLFVGEVDRMFSTGLPQESTMGRVITQLSLSNGLLNDLYLGMEVS